MVRLAAKVLLGKEDLQKSDTAPRAKYDADRYRLSKTAVLHHLSALDAIPTDLVIPPAILVSQTAGKLILDRIKTPKPPTAAMRVLYEAG